MISLSVILEEIKPGLISIQFTPSDKSLGTELEVTSASIVINSISRAIDLIMHASDKSENYVGNFVTPEWSEEFKQRLKKQW